MAIEIAFHSLKNSYPKERLLGRLKGQRRKEYDHQFLIVKKLLGVKDDIDYFCSLEINFPEFHVKEKAMTFLEYSLKNDAALETLDPKLLHACTFYIASTENKVISIFILKFLLNIFIS